ncbi:TolC family protein [Thalassoroseus pseudoceratinae]|uniref:TolC family protein n=1 Tax=Thalassoroseus pseudoceratinae TaxID=2713176 RepID=UPI00141EA105|nr:TolC family protein [Thalassoroseus pseudoceratinae]
MRTSKKYAIRQVNHESSVTEPEVVVPIDVPQRSMLTAEDVRCQAAIASAPVQLIEIERQFAFEKTSKSRCINEEVANQVQQLLMLRAAIRGNEASVAALKIYYQLAEGQSQLKFLQESLQAVEIMKSDARRILDRGFAVDIRLGDLERQQLEIRQQMSDIEGQLTQGWARLQTLLGEEPGSPMPNFGSLTVQATSPPGHENALQTAMHLRPELRLLRVLIHGMRSETLSAAIAALQQAEPSIGTASELDFLRQLSETVFIIKPFTKFCQTRNIEVRTTQLVVLLNNREQSVRGEVRAALAEWDAAYQRWNYTNKSVASWNQQIDELRRKREVDENITSFDIQQAELSRIEAESNLLSAIFACKQAEVSLLEAQGTAAIGCGLAGHEPFWCDSCKTTHGILHESPDSVQSHEQLVSPPSLAPAPAPEPSPYTEMPTTRTDRSIRSPRLIRRVSNASEKRKQTPEFQPTRSPLGRCHPISRGK